MSRANGKGKIFEGDVDRHDFIKTLAEACGKTGFEVHAYCLMDNHFHLVVETPHGNLVAGMRWFLSAYTLRFNPRHKRFGHVFSGRYKALVVDGSGDGYLKTVCDYVHLNPVRARLLKEDERLLEYPWSSFGLYLASPAHRPAWLRVDRLLCEHGIGRDTTAGRKEFEEQMEKRREQVEGRDPGEWKAIRRGWWLGTPEFKAELMARMDGKLGEHHSGAMKAGYAEARTERIVAEELKRRRWTERDLREQPKGAPEKLAIAARLRTETTLTIPAIAVRLHLGSWKSASSKIHHWRKAKENSQQTTL